MGGLFTQLMQWLLDLGKWIFTFFLNLFIDLLNVIIEAIAAVFSFALGFLPGSSINFNPPEGLLSVIGTVNWFVPLCTVVSCIGVLALVFSSYFTIRPVLKFFHLT